MVEAAKESQEQSPTTKVPVVTQLNQVYQNINNSLVEVHQPRYLNLLTRFKQLYGVKPAFYVRAPGRVNIIGEHIDYCGYSVLPAALEQDFIIAYVTTDDDKITINNIDKDQYPQQEISTDPQQKFKESAHFLNYFLCGYKAILANNSPVMLGEDEKPKGMKILIDSVVPQAAGLSSSSAFTVCTAITTLHVNGLIDKLDQATLAELTIKAERMAGTACGGMDQTISVMGKFNTAKLIDFIPALKATDVKVPDSVALVVANSLTPSAKILTVGTRYNKRVVECRFGVGILAIKTGLAKSFDECPFNTFYELQKALNKSFAEMLDLVKTHLKQGGYTVQMLQREGNVADPFDFMVSNIPHLSEVQSQNTAFYVYERAYHVFGEAKRVHDFKETCDLTDIAEEERTKKLGELMNQSQTSCDMLYDCSSKQLNELVKLARESGALGSRLTGAGWGGCCVSLVKKDQVSDFIGKVMSYYEKERPPGEQLWVTDDLNRYIFGTAIGQGACVLNPQFSVWHA